MFQTNFLVTCIELLQNLNLEQVEVQVRVYDTPYTSVTHSLQLQNTLVLISLECVAQNPTLDLCSQVCEQNDDYNQVVHYATDPFPRLCFTHRRITSGEGASR